MMRPAMAMMAMMAAALPAAASAQGDAAKGRTVFARCMACHQTVAGRNGLGPSLAGVVGRKAAAVPGYTYSAAMKGSGLTWTPPVLDQYLTKPSARVPGSKMIFAGIPDAAMRADLIAYLATLK